MTYVLMLFAFWCLWLTLAVRENARTAMSCIVMLQIGMEVDTLDKQTSASERAKTWKRIVDALASLKKLNPSAAEDIGNRLTSLL